MEASHWRPRVLITQLWLRSLAGSEVLTLEFAKHLRTVGCEVTVYTHRLNDSLASEFSSHDVAVATSAQNPQYRLSDFGLVWIHHQIVPPSLIEDLTRRGQAPDTSIVTHHMSPVTPLESCFALAFDAEVADLAATNSPETLSALRAAFGPTETIVLSNPAPEEFWEARPWSGGQRLERVLVVSNHVPAELTDAADLLDTAGVSVEFAGIGHTPRAIDPDTLMEYDLVVSIGKTVQYCLALGLPVYCYDHFGGPGYLTPASWERARWHNFSGRPFERAPDARALADDIRSGYAAALGRLGSLRDLASDMRWGVQWDRVTAALRAPSETHKRSLPVGSVHGLTALHEITRQVSDGPELHEGMAKLGAALGSVSAERDALRSQSEELRTRNRALVQEEARLRGLIDEFETSTSWRVTAPLRRIKDLLSE